MPTCFPLDFDGGLHCHKNFILTSGVLENVCIE